MYCVEFNICPQRLKAGHAVLPDSGHQLSSHRGKQKRKCPHSPVLWLLTLCPLTAQSSPTGGHRKTHSTVLKGPGVFGEQGRTVASGTQCYLFIHHLLSTIITQALSKASWTWKVPGPTNSTPIRGKSSFTQVGTPCKYEHHWEDGPDLGRGRGAPVIGGGYLWHTMLSQTCPASVCWAFSVLKTPPCPIASLVQM